MSPCAHPAGRCQQPGLALLSPHRNAVCSAGSQVAGGRAKAPQIRQRHSKLAQQVSFWVCKLRNWGQWGLIVRLSGRFLCPSMSVRVPLCWSSPGRAHGVSPSRAAAPRTAPGSAPDENVLPQVGSSPVPLAGIGRNPPRVRTVAVGPVPMAAGAAGQTHALWPAGHQGALGQACAPRSSSSECVFSSLNIQVGISFTFSFQTAQLFSLITLEGVWPLYTTLWIHLMAEVLRLCD